MTDYKLIPTVLELILRVILQSVPVCSEFERILILIVLEVRAPIWQPHALPSLLTYHIHKAFTSIFNQGGVGRTQDISQSSFLPYFPG